MIRFAIKLAVIFASAGCLFACQQATVSSEAHLPVTTLQARSGSIQVEVAKTARQRAQGLMFRQALADQHGMLFMFPAASLHCFWMKNTALTLAVAFMADDGSIVNIEQMQPNTQTLHCAAKPVRWAMETHPAWFAEHAIVPGSKISGLELIR